MKLIVLFLFPISLAFGATGKEIMEKQKQLQKTNTEIEVQKMVLIDKSGNKENRTLKRQIKDFGKEKYRTLLVFSEPADIKGTALLSWQNEGKDADQWLYLPAQGKMQRIAKGSKKNYFMGTDFTYEDLEPEEISDFNYNLLREEACDTDKKCFVVESTPINKEKASESGYSKRVLWIRTDIYATIKAEYYDKRDKHIKTQTSLELTNISKTVWRPKKTIMDNLKENHKTLMASAQLDANGKIEDQVFSENFILKGEHTK